MTTKTLSLITATLLLTTQTFAEETLEDTNVTTATETTLKDINVTTATKTTQKISDITSNINVITSDELEDRGFTTVAEALSTLPGVSFSSNGGLGGTTSVYVRGFSTQRTLVLIDGVRFNDNTSTSGASFEHLMIADIEQIEVVKGAQSGVWGADASAGVINIISKKAKSGSHGEVHVEAGSFKTQKYGITLSQTSENYYIKASHNEVHTDGFSAQAPRGEEIDNFEDDAYENKTSLVQAGFNINETNKIDISHQIIDADTQYDGFNTPNDTKSKSTTKNTLSFINFNHIDSFNEVDIYAKMSKFDREFVSSFDTSAYDGKVKEYGFKSKIPYGAENFILFGVDYKSFEHENTINKKFNNQGYFLTSSSTFDGFISGKTILTKSIRYDKYSKFDNKFTGKLGLKHIHGNIEGLTTSVNYGTAYNVPTLYQLFAPATSFGAIGNADLTPETTKSFDVSVSYKDLTLTYFHNKITDLIGYGNGYENIDGTSTIKGFEASYQAEVMEDLLLSVNYTKLSAKDAKGKTLVRRPEQTLNVAVDYYGVKNLHVGVDASYVGSRKDVIFNPDFSTSDVQTGKYTVVNFTTDYQIAEAFKVYGKVVNVTDKYYQTAYGYATSPRAFSLGLKATF